MRLLGAAGKRALQAHMKNPGYAGGYLLKNIAVVTCVSCMYVLGNVFFDS